MGGAEALRGSIDKIRTDMLQPYQQLKERTRHLANIQSAAELLRRVLRHQTLTKKLKSQVGVPGSTQSDHILR